MLLITTRKSLVTAKPCCGGCAKGKPCCGSKKKAPKFSKQGGLWLPERGNTRTSQMAKLKIPIWPLHREFILAAEKILPIRRVGVRFGNPARWRRQMRTIYNLVTLPPDQWGGLVRWDLPAFMPVYDMSCTGCCASQCCCSRADDFPASLKLSITSTGACSTCPDRPLPLVDEPLPVTQPVDECDVPGDVSFEFQTCTALDCTFCTAGGMTLSCGEDEGSGPFGLWELNFDNCGEAAVLEVTSCDPMTATGQRTLSEDCVDAICGDFSQDTVTIVIEEP